MLNVLILCGGKGERLRPLTNNIPKPMIEINKKPILSYIIKHLGIYGINDLIFALGYKSKIIHEYLTSYNKDT
jgi:glucose-1-phosphate cytidylyltransferase